MSSRGKAFTSVVKCVYNSHGFGSTKTHTEYFTMFDSGRHGYTSSDLDWLVSNGYLFHFKIDRVNHKRNWRYERHTDDIYGVTKKGWSIAHLYVQGIK